MGYQDRSPWAWPASHSNPSWEPAADRVGEVAHSARSDSARLSAFHDIPAAQSRNIVSRDTSFQLCTFPYSVGMRRHVRPCTSDPRPPQEIRLARSGPSGKPSPRRPGHGRPTGPAGTSPTHPSRGTYTAAARAPNDEHIACLAARDVQWLSGRSSVKVAHWSAPGDPREGRPRKGGDVSPVGYCTALRRFVPTRAGLFHLRRGDRRRRSDAEPGIDGHEPLAPTSPGGIGKFSQLAFRK